MRTYVGIVRDHSGSMTSLRNGAAADYNKTLNSIKLSLKETNQDGRLSVVECGAGRRAEVKTVESNRVIEHVNPYTGMYHTDGGSTPLWDSVGAVIEDLWNAATTNGDVNDTTTAFLVLVITDGGENSSKKWTGSRLASKIQELQASDRWTFAFRVPRNHARYITNIGVAPGNVMEWEQNEASLVRSTEVTTQSVGSYFTARASGVRSTQTFYVDASAISGQQVQQNLTDVTSQIDSAYVSRADNGTQIRNFCIKYFGKFAPGHAYYQLTKREEVQDYKGIAIREKATNKIYAGPTARIMLGLQAIGTIKIAPGDKGDYDIFIQSNSVNRKLVQGTTVLYI